MTRSIRDVLVLCDMDGTLLTPEKEILRCDIEMIRLFTELGGRFTIATGRVADAVAMYDELIPYLQPAITSGGCAIYDFNRKEIVASEQLNYKTAYKAVHDIIRTFPSIGVVIMGSDGKTYLYKPSNESARLFQDEKSVYFVRPFTDIPAQWNKVLFAGEPELLQKLQSYVQRRVYPNVEFVMTNTIYFEMMPEGISKGTAMLTLCDLLQIPVQNTIAIGDYHNDIDMMRLAGYSVAMRDAPVEVQIVADELTGSNEDGGVGQFLYKLIRQYNG